MITTAHARLADDWTEQRQACIDVLCAYLRMPYATGMYRSAILQITFDRTEEFFT